MYSRVYRGLYSIPIQFTTNGYILYSRSHQCSQPGRGVNRFTCSTPNPFIPVLIATHRSVSSGTSSPTPILSAEPERDHPYKQSAHEGKEGNATTYLQAGVENVETGPPTHPHPYPHPHRYTHPIGDAWGSTPLSQPIGSQTIDMYGKDTV